jgi:hypothetical protein
MKTINHYHVLKTSRIAIFSTVIVLLIIFDACSGNNDLPLQGINMNMSDLAGNWTATSANFNGPDLVADGGAVTLAIQSDGRFTWTLQRPEENSMVFTGRFGFDEQWLAVEYDGYPGDYEYYDIDLRDNKNNLYIGGNSEFDYDEDGIDELVIFYLDMIRN